MVMGATRDDFIEYPRTPHLFGAKGTEDDGCSISSRWQTRAVEPPKE